MTILEYFISFHVTFVEIFLAVVIVNLLPVYIFRKTPTKSVKWTRIGFFAFWGAWTMVVFAALVVWSIMQFKLDIKIISMLIATLLLAHLDGYRAVKLKKLWVAGSDGIKFNTIIVVAEIAVIAVVTLYTIKL